MSLDKLKFKSNETDEIKTFETELRSLEANLQNLINGKKVDYEAEIKKAQTLLESLKIKHKDDPRVAKFVAELGVKIGSLVSNVGTWVSLLLGSKGLPAEVVGESLVFEGLSLAELSRHKIEKISEHARMLAKEIKELIETSRGFTALYLQKDGARVGEGGRLEVTSKQVQKADREMEEDIEKRGEI